MTPSSREVNQLRVWEEHLAFVGFDQTELAELDREFHGSVCRSESAAVHTFVRRQALPRITRHLGGSSAQKFLSDNSQFDAAIQERFAEPVVSSDEKFRYLLDGSLCEAERSTTTVVSWRLMPFVLSDLVENLLLGRARERGWVQCHAAAWAEGGGATLLIGSSGAGKTTALLEAVKRGALLVSNDRVFLRLHEGRLEARGFPLPMNIGCGTIRSLGLDLPHFGL